MDEKYRDWIAQNVPEAYGACREITSLMAAAFPELTRVRGHYYCLVWGERAHWWLETQTGGVVDPTAMQFPSKGAGSYVPWREGARGEPTGMCPNCGGQAYNGDTCCSDECGREYVAFCSQGL